MAILKGLLTLLLIAAVSADVYQVNVEHFSRSQRSYNFFSSVEHVIKKNEDLDEV